MVFTREKFLCGATATMLSAPTFVRAVAAEAGPANDRVLILIEMGGGNDAFNTVLDLKQYSAYASARSNIAISTAAIAATQTGFDADHTKPSSSNSAFAFNPVMSGMRHLYGQGKVAVIGGIGIPPEAYDRLSHPGASFTWHCGQVNKFDQTNIGWVGATFDQLPQAKNQLPSLVSFSGRALAFQATKTPMLSLNGTHDLSQFNTNVGAYAPDTTARLNALYAGDKTVTDSAVGEFARQVAANTTNYITAVQSYAKQQTLDTYPLPPAGDPNVVSNLAMQFKQAARLLLAGSSIQAFYMTMGGFDFHNGQDVSQPPRLAELSDAVAGFVTFMEAANPALAKRIVIATTTDFGRRLESNNTAGTDHGTAGVNFVIGSSVKGGYYGQYPSLTQRDHNNNVYVQVDFRQELAELITWMNGDPTAILGTSYSGAGSKIGFLL